MSKRLMDANPKAASRACASVTPVCTRCTRWPCVCLRSAWTEGTDAQYPQRQYTPELLGCVSAEGQRVYWELWCGDALIAEPTGAPSEALARSACDVAAAPVRTGEVPALAELPELPASVLRDAELEAARREAAKATDPRTHCLGRFLPGLPLPLPSGVSAALPRLKGLKDDRLQLYDL